MRQTVRLAYLRKSNRVNLETSGPQVINNQWLITAQPYSIGRWRKVVLRILPVALRGKAGIKTTFRGTL